MRLFVASDSHRSPPDLNLIEWQREIHITLNSKYKCTMALSMQRGMLSCPRISCDLQHSNVCEKKSHTFELDLKSLDLHLEITEKSCCNGEMPFEKDANCPIL